MTGRTDLLVVGDVHGQWDDVDRAFVERGEQDCAVFVGDFGEEDVALVERVAALDCEKVVILGNHDAWVASRGGPFARMRRQMEALGEAHLAYAARRVGAVLLVGGRPFSWGGDWSHDRAFYEMLFEVGDDEASAGRMLAAASAVPDLPIVLVAHNGPTGLGDGRDAIYGRDFRRPFTDFGDSDLRLALDRLRSERPVPLTIAGHMHSRLRGGGQRQRVAREGGTLHVNTAVVPRHVHEGGGTLRHFVRIAITGTAAAALDIWVDDAGVVRREHPLE